VNLLLAFFAFATFVETSVFYYTTTFPVGILFFRVVRLVIAWRWFINLFV
jgi:hypothetical protein